MTSRGKGALANAEPVEDCHEVKIGINPTDISLEDKHELVRKYNELIKSQPGVSTSSSSYIDSRIKQTYANTDGSFITQIFPFCGVSLVAMAKEEADVQYAFHSVGDLKGYDKCLNLEEKCLEVAKKSVDILNAKPVTAGTYQVMADPELAGVFAHEAFGHLSEADFVYENEEMAKVMQLGRKFGKKELNIVDQGDLEGEGGFLKYDAEGVKTRRTDLIKEGVLVGRLHSRETASMMNEKITGNARAISYNHQPIVRMTNTFIEPGEHSISDIQASIENGIYCKGSGGGQTNGQMFTFAAEEAFIIKDGEIGERVRNVNLQGDVFNTLANIDMIGNDFSLFGGLGGCGKGGQSPLRVSDGGPHLRIQEVVIGGA